MFDSLPAVFDDVSAATETPRARILAVARELFRGGDYDAVHVGELIRKAGVSRATFYRLFASKEEVFTEVCSERPLRRDALARVKEGAREAFGQHGYERVKMEHMIAASGVARSTFYRFFKDKHSAFVELDNTAFQFLRWEIGVSSVDPEGRAAHLRFTAEAFVEWRSQVGRSSLQPGCLPGRPQLQMVAFHTLLDGVDPNAPKAKLACRLPSLMVEALMVAVDAIAQQPFEGDLKTQNLQRVEHVLMLLEPAVRAPQRPGWT